MSGGFATLTTNGLDSQSFPAVMELAVVLSIVGIRKPSIIFLTNNQDLSYVRRVS